MNADNFLNVVENLNSELMVVAEGSYNQGMSLEYRSNFYVDTVYFMGIVLWDNQNDSYPITEKDLEDLLRERIIDIFKSLGRWEYKFCE